MTAQLRSWAQALGGEVSGGGILCPGPGHTAVDRSLSVKIGRDGEPICYSHSGDDPILCKDFVREKIGLKRFKPNGHAKAPSAKRHFDYLGPDGALLYQVERDDLPDGGKKIRQRRPDGNGGWVWNLDGVTPVPYRLPELLEALAHGRMVATVEGEAKADLLWSWNVPATCNSGGAGKWRAQHSAYLRGADAVVLPDNDEPGRRHAEIVAASLMETGATVRVLDLPGLPPKGDVINWAAAGGTPEQLHALIENTARPWAADAQAPKKPKFQLTPFNDIKFETADEWLVKKLLPRKGVAAIYGASGSVKTFILLDLFFHIALDWPWAGRRVVQAPTIYIAAEGAAGLHKRKIGWELAHDGLPDNVPFHLIEVAPNLGAGASDLKELIASIEAAGIKPGAIAIDTVAQSMGVGDENNTGMVQFAANITALANHFGCLVAAVHHVGLGDEKRLRGHTSFLGALDASILSERKEGALSATLTVMKLKDEESAQKFTVHLARVVIGKDSDAEDVSTLIVESVESGATEGAKAPQAKAIPRAQRLLIAMVEQAIGGDETAKMIRPFADGPLVKAVSDDAVRRRYYARIAENARPGEDNQKLRNRQRQAFHAAIRDALKALILMACERDGTRFIWLP